MKYSTETFLPANSDTMLTGFLKGRWTASMAAVLSGALLTCAYPPVYLGFLAYIALVPLLAIAHLNPVRKTFALTYVAGLTFLGSSLFWIYYSTWVGMIIAILVLSVFFAVPFALTAYIRRTHPRLALFVFPFAFSSVEWLRSFDQLAFPWMILGNSQTSYPHLIQFADITSVYGVSCWIAVINIIIFMLFIKRSVSRFAALALLFVVPAAYSYFVINSGYGGERTVTVSLIQGNVSPLEKWRIGLEEWNIKLYAALSEEAKVSGPDLIIWPETAIPTYFADIPSYREMVRAKIDSLGIPVLTGLPSIDFATEETWNSAALLVPGKRDIRRYDKIHLVPFGEAFPLDNHLKFLRDIDFGQANWNEGHETVVYSVEGLPPFSPAICFESIFPDLIRSFVVAGSQLLVIITNDVWFAPVVAPEQHAMIAVMRAVEFHRPVARCANLGISLFIDQYGRITKQTRINERTILTDTLTTNDSMTFYARFGNVFSVAATIITLISAAGAYFTRKSASASTDGYCE